jgi:hypothetical protein
MKKPTTIKIGAIYYEVVAVEKLLDEKHSKLDGSVRHARTQISLEVDMNHQATVQTLLHEIVHIVATQLGKQELEEPLVDSIAYAAYQVLRDNPEFVRLVMKKDAARA